MNPAAKDAAHAFLRAVSPFLATCPGTHDSHQAPGNSTSEQPSGSPNLSQPVWAGTAKVCQKTDHSDRFLPTTNSSSSKKVIEDKDTTG